jgi:hypothetical protein
MCFGLGTAKGKGPDAGINEDSHGICRCFL